METVADDSYSTQCVLTFNYVSLVLYSKSLTYRVRMYPKGCKHNGLGTFKL